MELAYAHRLLLDFAKGCPYHGIQATGKTGRKERMKEKKKRKEKRKKKEEKKHMILCVLNNELT